MKFKLHAGLHVCKVNGEQRTFKPGDIVESDVNLMTRHGFEKFELLPSSEAEASPGTPSPPRPNQAPAPAVVSNAPSPKK